MKKLLSISIVLSLSLLACNTSSHAALIDFTIMLTGPQETPGNASGAAGGGIAVFDTVTDQISVNVLFTGLSDTATASHIHDGAPGASGPVIVSFVPFAPATTAGTITGTPQPFPAARVSDLLAGNNYFEIRDAALPNGEIRGQLVPVTQSLPTITPVPGSANPTSVNFVFGLTGSQETPANAGGGAAGGIATYDAIANTISISAAFTGLSSPATPLTFMTVLLGHRVRLSCRLFPSPPPPRPAQSLARPSPSLLRMRVISWQATPTSTFTMLRLSQERFEGNSCRSCMPHLYLSPLASC
jgi:hypothetical protein